jgi:hypothetical protein
MFVVLDKARTDCLAYISEESPMRKRRSTAFGETIVFISSGAIWYKWLKERVHILSIRH